MHTSKPKLLEMTKQVGSNRGLLSKFIPDSQERRQDAEKKELIHQGNMKLIATAFKRDQGIADEITREDVGLRRYEAQEAIDKARHTALANAVIHEHTEARRIESQLKYVDGQQIILDRMHLEELLAIVDEMELPKLEKEIEKKKIKKLYREKAKVIQEPQEQEPELAESMWEE